MKIYCNNIDTIPDTEEIVDLTQQEHLVLEFPKDKINPKIESHIFSELKRELPENYSVFNSGILGKYYYNNNQIGSFRKCN